MSLKKISIASLKDYVDQSVNVSGWVDRVRDMKTMQFVVLRDRTGLVQVTNEKNGGDLEQKIGALVPESTVKVEGQVLSNKYVKLGQLEIHPTNLVVTSAPLGPLPIDSNSALESRLDYRFLDLRHPKNRTVFEVQTTIEQAMREYWKQEGFIEMHSPKLVSGATESGAELFQLDYFGKSASLAQSPQFYKQMAMAAGLERVFEIGPVFRANPSFTSRHDTEFTSVDVELSWVDSHHDVMEFEENWLHYVLSVVKDKHGNLIKERFGVDVKVPSLPFPKVSMKEAYDILASIGHSAPRKEKGDLDPEGERLLAKSIKEKYDHEFVFVTDYPTKVRPFYHMRNSEDKDVTNSFDLIWKGVEVTTGAQREHRYDILLQQAIEKGIDPSAVSDYLGFFKYGVPPHGGFGFGLTRMLMMLFEAPNVREVTYLPRNPNRLTP